MVEITDAQADSCAEKYQPEPSQKCDDIFCPHFVKYSDGKIDCDAEGYDGCALWLRAMGRKILELEQASK